MDPEQSVVIIIDHEPQMYFGVESHEKVIVQNSIVGLAKAAKLFKVPCILTTVAESYFSGPMYSAIMDVYPGTKPIDRTAINSWEDENLVKAVKETGRKKLVLGGLWTEACILFPALSALSEGYDVYVATDACGGASKEAHKMAIMRMNQAGVKMVTWMQVMLEFQRDWNNTDTYNGVMEIVKQHGGAYGLGVAYAETMVEAYKKHS